MNWNDKSARREAPQRAPILHVPGPRVCRAPRAGAIRRVAARYAGHEPERTQRGATQSAACEFTVYESGLGIAAACDGSRIHAAGTAKSACGSIRSGLESTR